ncbi:MAG TPA: DUF2007 domain-containing protein [Prolixibacteraceae bacterium]|jgi:hypothetical protein
MEKGWIIVYSTADEYLCTIAKELLQENEIESVLMNHKDSAYAFMGEIELYVREEDEKKAARILEQLKTA